MTDLQPQELQVIYEEDQSLTTREERLQHSIDVIIQEKANITSSGVRIAVEAYKYVQQRQADGLTHRQAVEEVAYRTRSGTTSIYNAVRVITIFGHILADPHSVLSKRVEAGLETISSLVARTRAPDPIAELEKPELDDLSSHEIEAHYKEQKQITAEQEHGPPEKLETKTCPTCDGDGVIPVG